MQRKEIKYKSHQICKSCKAAAAVAVVVIVVILSAVGGVAAPFSWRELDLEISTLAWFTRQSNVLLPQVMVGEGRFTDQTEWPIGKTLFLVRVQVVLYILQAMCRGVIELFCEGHFERSTLYIPYTYKKFYATCFLTFLFFYFYRIQAL